MTANPILVAKQGISKEAVEEINKLHIISDKLVNEMQISQLEEDYVQLFDEWTRVQYKLQELWKFKKDWTKHEGWRLPHCTCPKMDNSDAGYHYCVSCDCPLHHRPLNHKVLSLKSVEKQL